MLSTFVLSTKDPQVVEELLAEKNKFYDKHFILREMVKSAIKNSLTMMNTDDDWAARRKIFAQAFTKDKLIKMTEVIKQSTIETV